MRRGILDFYFGNEQIHLGKEHISVQGINKTSDIQQINIHPSSGIFFLEK